MLCGTNSAAFAAEKYENADLFSSQSHHYVCCCVMCKGKSVSVRVCVANSGSVNMATIFTRLGPACQTAIIALLIHE